MQTTKSTAMPVPANPWSSMPKERGIPSSRTAVRRVELPSPRTTWIGAANIALVILVVVAGFAMWRSVGDQGGPRDNPGVALQPSTPESVEAPAAQSSPVASAEPVTSCNLSGDIPIVPEVAEGQVPLATTYLAIVQYDRMKIDNPRGDLELGCDGEASVVLAENVIWVSPGPWPGTVYAGILPPEIDDPAFAEYAYINIATGGMITFAPPSNAPLMQAPVTDSPWVIGPSADGSGALVIADLRTMEARPFSEVAGLSAPADVTVMMSSPADDGSLAVGFASFYEAGAMGGALMTDLDAPGDLLLLGDSFDDVTWIAAPESLPRIGAISLSPDGAHAIVTSMGEGDVVAGSFAYVVVDLTDGAVIANSGEIPNNGDRFIVWAPDGGAVAYLDGPTLQTLSIDGDGQPETVFEADSQLLSLQTTWDPNVVVVATRMDHGADGAGDQAARDAVYSVNLDSGAIHEFVGVDASATVGWITDAGALVMYQWDDARPDLVTYQVFDPVTGDQIGEIADAPSVQPASRTLLTLGPRSVSVSETGRVEVIALGTQNIYAFIAGADGLEMRRVASPEGMLSESFLTANVILSPDGSMLSLNGEEDEGRTRYVISLDDPNADWVTIENTVVSERGLGLITFAAGGAD
jgi:hypothetical protein